MLLQDHDVHGVDDSDEKVNAHPQFISCRRLAQNPQCLSQEPVAAVELRRGSVRLNIGFAAESREEQGIGQRLCVCIGELEIVSIGEQRLTPLRSQLAEVGIGIFQCCFHVPPNQTAQGSKQVRQSCRVGRYYRFPEQEVPHHFLKSCSVLTVNRCRSVSGNVSGKADELTLLLAVPEQRPF